MKTISNVVGVAIGLVLLGLSTSGNASTITYLQDSDHCTGNCGINTANTVTITDEGQAAGTLEIKVSLTSGWSFINTGAGDAAFAFSSSLNNLDLTILATTTFAATWSDVGPVASLKMNGLTFPTSAYGADTTLGPNNSTGNNLLDFTVFAAGLTFDTFIASLQFATEGANTSTSLFAADVLSPKTGCTGAGTTCTGIIDWGGVSQVPGPIAGAGLPALIIACGGLLGLARRRRQQIA